MFWEQISHEYQTPVAVEISQVRQPSGSDNFGDFTMDKAALMWDSVFELPKDWPVIWEERIIAAEMRIEIAQAVLAKLALKDQLKLFDE